MPAPETTASFLGIENSLLTDAERGIESFQRREDCFDRLGLGVDKLSIACMCPTMESGISVGQADRMAPPALLDADLNS
jgi:hypothetical protein